MKLEVFYRESGKDALSDIRHSHDGDLELIQILSGTGKVFVGEHVIPFSGECVFLIDGGALHYICPESDAPYTRNKLILNKELLGGLCLPYGGAGYLCRTLSHEAAMEISRKFEAISAIVGDERQKLLLLSGAFELLHVCCTLQDTERTPYHGMVADVVAYIHDHLTQGVSLDAVAHALHVNKFYLCRLFKRETGMTVGSYINSARIALAKRLLRNGGKSVTFIASECGFNELSVFTRNFKKEVGMPPTEYRSL